MENNDIKKALECCSINEDCTGCHFWEKDNRRDDCLQQAVKDALALINSQEQRIKELTEENERLKARVLEEKHLRHQAEEMLANGMSVVRADTVQKVCLICKEKARLMTDAQDVQSVAVDIYDIDQIAKELEGEE